MGNITGEHFLPYVTNQIKQRQEQLGKVTRGDDQLFQQNAKSAWIKLTSSILVKDTSKFNFPSDVADKYSLFGADDTQDLLIRFDPQGIVRSYTFSSTRK